MKDKQLQKPASQIDIENAKKLLAETDRQELDAIGEEVTAVFTALNKRGFAVLPSGNFVGHNMRLGWQIVRTQEPASTE